MSVAHYSLTIFVALNAARAIAYWPQIVSIYRDPGRASAVSVWTWIVFTAANVATVIYALAGLEDLIVAAVFGVNAIGCAAIVMLTTYKRCHHPVWKNICAELLRESDCLSVGVTRRHCSAARERPRLGSTPGLQNLEVASLPADGTGRTSFREALKHPPHRPR